VRRLFRSAFSNNLVVHARTFYVRGCRDFKFFCLERSFKRHRYPQIGSLYYVAGGQGGLPRPFDHFAWVILRRLFPQMRDQLATQRAQICRCSSRTHSLLSNCRRSRWAALGRKRLSWPGVYIVFARDLVLHLRCVSVLICTFTSHRDVQRRKEQQRSNQPMIRMLPASARSQIANLVAPQAVR
jgi:hypothetical protein